VTVLVVDASFVVAALVVEDGLTGAWAERLAASTRMAAPPLLYPEVTNQLRRFALSGLISDDVSSLAFAELRKLRIDLYPFAPIAARVWELRKNITPYDAWYVALAELLDAPLATLDLRLTRAPGPTCSFSVPPTVATP
jgi:predicted nucleic acid-binding protein